MYSEHIYMIDALNMHLLAANSLSYRTSVTFLMKENKLSNEKLFKFETANFMYRHFNFY